MGWGRRTKGGVMCAHAAHSASDTSDQEAGAGGSVGRRAANTSRVTSGDLVHTAAKDRHNELLRGLRVRRQPIPWVSPNGR